jgi:ribose-phosphate pyrophosphokinase
MRRNRENLRILGGSANPELTKAIAGFLDMEPAHALVTKFPNGETRVRVEEDVRGRDVFIVQSTCPPTNDHLMELLIMIDCVRRSSATRITAVMPHFGYARQDRKDEGRVPITAKLVANLVSTAGADRVITIDLHAAQIQGFFDIPLDHLFASPILGRHYQDLAIPDLTVVSPDVGGIKMARAYAKRLGAGLAIVDKRRRGPDEVEAGYVIGDVKDRNVLMMDDQIHTAGSVVQAAKVLTEHGAKDVYVGVTHPVFCGDALAKLDASPVKQVAVTDTIPLGAEAAARDYVQQLSVAGLLGEAIRRIHMNESVSKLFT